MPSDGKSRKRKSSAGGNKGHSTKKRGRRVDKAMLAELYAMLYARMARPVTEASLSKEFSDKELRVLMKHNGMLINDYDQRTGSYSEKTKVAKCKILVAAAPTMIVPGSEPDAGQSPGNAAAAAAPYRRKAKPAKARGSANRAAARPPAKAPIEPAPGSVDRPRRGSGMRKVYAEPSSDESDSDSEGEAAAAAAGGGQWPVANGVGAGGGAGYFAAAGQPQPPRIPDAAAAAAGAEQARSDPFAARPSLDKLSFDMAEEEDTSPGRTEKDVMYLGGEIGLLDDDGSQLRPVEEPGTDPEPWKVFTPLSYEPGNGESLVDMMTNTVSNTVSTVTTAASGVLRRLASPNAAQGQNYDAFARQPPAAGSAAAAAPSSSSAAAGRRPAEGAKPAEGTGTSWWQRFSPTAALAKSKSADAIFSVPPPREPASARRCANPSPSRPAV